MSFTKIIAQSLIDAIDKNYLAGKQNIIKQAKKEFSDTLKIDYNKIDQAAIRYFQIEAFTVAGIGNYELEEKLKKLAVECWEKHEQDFGWFEENARRIMIDYIPIEDQAPSGYLKTNLNTAVNGSYKAAEWKELHNPDIKGIYSAYQYKTQEDDVVRDEHEALDDLILPADDPAWEKIWPPNDWNCRCYIMPLTDDEAGDNVKDLSESERSDIEDIPGPDFRFNPGQEDSIWGNWLTSKMKDIPNDVMKQIKKDVYDFFKTIK